MKNILTAIALTIAIPAVAQAQTVPAPAAKTDCCEKMKAAGKDMAGMDHSKMDHSKMDHSKMDHSKMNMQPAPQPQPAPSQIHQH